MLGDGVEQRVGIADRGDDVDARVGEEADDAVAEQHRIVGDDRANGVQVSVVIVVATSAMIVVGPPTGDVTLRVPSTALTRARIPAMPVPFDMSTPPTPSSWIVTRTLAATLATWTDATRARACLSTFAIASLATK